MKSNEEKLLRLSLQFFAEGGEGGAVSGARGDGSLGQSNGAGNEAGIDSDDIFLAEIEQKFGVTNGVASAQAAEFVRTSGSVAHSEKAPKSEGGENTAADGEGAVATESQDTEKTPEEEFDELVRSDKFKGIYGKKLSDAVSARFKNQTDAKGEADKYKGALGLLASKYGKSADDVEGIIAAIQSDDELLEAEAVKAGTTVEKLRSARADEASKKAAESEISSLRERLRAQESENRARADAERWAREAVEAKKLFGDSFDLRKELKNESFMKFLTEGKGMSVSDAYKHAHIDELMSSAIKTAESRAEINAAKVVEANGRRVREAAATPSNASAVTRIDLNTMTDAEFERIEELRRRGVRVTDEYFK